MLHTKTHSYKKSYNKKSYKRFARIFLFTFFLVISLVTFFTSAKNLKNNGVFKSFQADKTKQKLVVYSARKEHLIKPVFKEFEKETGIKVIYITDKANALIQRLMAEKKNTLADVLFTVDAGNLWMAKKKGLLSSFKDKTLTQNIPPHLRDPEGYWYGLSVRGRTIIYNSKKVKPSELSTYEGLADSKWKGKLCLRTSKKVYNQSLVASMMVHKGEEETKKVLKGWVNNLAAPVFSSDTKMIEAIAAGQCDIGVGNTYYLGRLHRDGKALDVKLFWPNQKGRGVHVNISGGGIIKTSKNKENAKKLLIWLSGEQAQNLFASLNLEYAVNPKAYVSSIVESWGVFKQDQLNLNKVGELQINAIKLMDQVGYY